MPPRGQSASSPGPRGTSGARSAPTCCTNPRGCPARGPVPERCSAARPRFRDGAHHGWAAERPAPPCGRREAASAVTPNLRLDGCERCREQDDAGRNGGPASAGHLKRAPPGPDMRGAPGPRTFTGRLGASLPQLSAAALARARNLPGFPVQLSLPGRFTLRVHFPWSTPHVSAVPGKMCRRRSRAAGTCVTICHASLVMNSERHPRWMGATGWA
jgi:hypothetical protein